MTKAKTKLAYKINEALAKKLLKVVDKGLCQGMDEGTNYNSETDSEIPIPGKMCVEAAVCFALGLPHSDKPPCVAPWLISLKIAFNDNGSWDSNKARAKTLRRLAIVQLGTKEKKLKASTFNSLFKKKTFE